MKFATAPRLHVRMAVSLLLLLVAATMIGCQDEARIARVVAGGCSPDSSPFLQQDPGLRNARITYCGGGDAATAVIETGVFPPGTKSVTIAIAGYPDVAGIRLEAIPTQGGETYELEAGRIGDRWASIELSIPEPLSHRAFRIRLSDNSRARYGWAGIGFATMLSPGEIAHRAMPLLLMLLLPHAWISLLALNFAKSPRFPQPHIFAVVAMGLCALGTFCAYAVGPRIGRIAAVTFAIAPAVAGVALLLGRRRSLLQLQELQSRFLPTMALAAFVLWIGLYPFDWDGTDWRTPGRRWLNLPVDNWLPFVFAEMLKEGEIRSPMVGDWLSSDRPPLQTGLYLVFDRLYAPGGGLLYQVVSTWAQSLVLVPLSLLLGQASGRHAQGLILFAVATSALVVLNSLFVWPKLLAASYCLIYHLYLFRSRETYERSYLIAGMAAALALLSHGGALFALVGSTVAFLASGRAKAVLRTLTVAGVAIVFYLPWLAYQSLVDPPGDRLIKWHFAGAIPPTKAPLLTVLRDAYSELTLQQWLLGRIGNVRRIFEGTLAFFRDTWLLVGADSPGMASHIVNRSFFLTAYSTWFASPLLAALVVISLAVLKRKRLHEPMWPPGMIAALAWSFLFWALVMFEPGSTVIHQGAYMSNIIFMVAILLVYARASMWVLIACIAGNTCLTVALYVLDRSTQGITYVAPAIALLALLLTVCLRTSEPCKVPGDSTSPRPETTPA